jgi:iron complex transport system substrate-binding protein
MARPDFAFRTSRHTVYAEGGPVYRAEPGGMRLQLTLAAQGVPAELLDAEMERAVMAWVLARGGRRLNLNGDSRPLHPAQLDRPARGPVRRLVSIAPSNAEIVGALDAAGLLVGVESSSDFPPEVRGLPRLGPDLNVNLEALQRLAPDLVLASLSVPGMERNVAGLERLGLPTLVLAPQSVAEIRADILRVGAALGRAERAQAVVERMDGQLAELGRHCAGQPPVPVYLEWWPKPMFTPGGACWTNELIERAGGVNVFRERQVQSEAVEVEDLVRADPEVILVAWCGVPFDKLDVRRVLTRPGLEGVRAVRNGRVVAIDESLLGRPGPRVTEGALRIAEALRGAAGTLGGGR